MAIPGYDPDDIAEFALDREGEGGATASVAAGTIPDVTVERGGDDAPDGALSEPVTFAGLGDVADVDAIRIALEYDSASLPAGANEDDVAVGVVTDDGVETLDSTVDSEAGVVSATTTGRVPGETVVAIREG